MDPRLRLERAIGVPDAIVDPQNRALVAGRLLAARVNLSFNTAEKRQRSGSWQLDRLVDVFCAGAVELIGPIYASGALDLRISGDDSELEQLTDLASDGAARLRAVVQEEASFNWVNTDDFQAMIAAVVDALRAWSLTYPVDPN